MAYQNYYQNGYPAGYPTYYPVQPQPYMNYQQRPMQPQPQGVPNTNGQQPFTNPINDVRFVTSDEARAFIVTPNQSALLIDYANKVAYFKSADAWGQSTSKIFAFEEKTQEQGAMNAPNVATKDDINKLAEVVAQLQQKLNTGIDASK